MQKKDKEDSGEENYAPEEETKKPKKSATKKKGKKKSKIDATPVETNEVNVTKQVIAEARQRQFMDLTEHCFKRIKHPSESIDFITEDSLRRALNVHDIEGVNDRVLTIMMEMAKEAQFSSQKAASKVQKKKSTTKGSSAQQANPTGAVQMIDTSISANQEEDEQVAKAARAELARLKQEYIAAQAKD